MLPPAETWATVQYTVAPSRTLVCMKIEDDPANRRYLLTESHIRYRFSEALQACAGCATIRFGVRYDELPE